MVLVRRSHEHDPVSVIEEECTGGHAGASVTPRGVAHAPTLERSCLGVCGHSRHDVRAAGVLAAIGIYPLAATMFPTVVMTEGERSLGSFPPWESPQLSLSAPGLSTRYLMPVHDIDCSKLHSSSEARARIAACADTRPDWRPSGRLTPPGLHEGVDQRDPNRCSLQIEQVQPSDLRAYRPTLRVRCTLAVTIGLTARRQAGGRARRPAPGRWPGRGLPPAVC